MHHLIDPDFNTPVVRRRGHLLDHAQPPVQRLACVDQQVRQTDQQGDRPGKDQRQAGGMDTAMDPRRRMTPIDLVDGHPFILEQPVGDQVDDNTPNQKNGCFLHERLSGVFANWLGVSFWSARQVWYELEWG